MIQSRMHLITLRDEQVAAIQVDELNTLRNEGFEIKAHGTSESFAWFMLEREMPNEKPINKTLTGPATIDREAFMRP